MAARIEPLMTVEDLVALPDDGNRYELIEGQLFSSGLLTLTHQQICGNLLYIIWTYLQANAIGEVIAAPGLIFSGVSSVIPDLVFFTHERGRRIISDDYLRAAPEFVIEVLSLGRENISRDRVAKRQLYAKHGVKEYWIVDSENRSVEVYGLTASGLELGSMLRNNDELTSSLLPGFTFLVSDFFKP